MSDHELPTSCPWCGRANPLHADTLDNREPPRPGDISICWECHWPSLFTEDGLRRPTPDELEELRAQPEWREVLGAVVDSWTPAEAAARTRRNP